MKNLNSTRKKHILTHIYTPDGRVCSKRTETVKISTLEGSDVFYGLSREISTKAEKTK